MPTLDEVVTRAARVRAALIRRYRWFIHTSPERNLDSIRKFGLRPNRDVDPSERRGVIEAYGPDVGPILCFHPLGAQECPAGADATAEPLQLGMDVEPRLVSFAVEGRDWPEQLALDWSYEWERVLRLLEEKYRDLPPEKAVVHIVNELGSIASLSSVEPEKLRVYCSNNSPTNPLSWALLLAAPIHTIIRHG